MTELSPINLALYAQTDIGMVRSGNEDNFLILDLSTGRSWTAMEEEPADLLTCEQGYYGTLLAVSDGMGGALAGEVAARMAVETVRDRMLQLQAHAVYGQLPFSERLRVAIEQANDLIHEESLTNPLHKGLGATFTAVATIGGEAYFAQVGDSRAYLIRRGQITRITKDQSLVQQLIDAGQITEEEAETHSYRNVILQALGAHSLVNVEINTISLCHQDTLVLCSDGLSGKIHEHEIARIVADTADFQSACQQMVQVANERGGEDNITVLIARFDGHGLSGAASGGVAPRSLIRSPGTPTSLNWNIGVEAEIEERDNSGLPAPPRHSRPFTAKIERSPERERTNDLSDRRGPITAVFALSEEIPPQTSPKTVIEVGHGGDSRDRAKSKSPARASNRPSSRRLSFGSSPGSPRNGSGRRARSGPFYAIAIIIVGLTMLAIGGAAYLKRQASAREMEQLAQVRERHDKQKEGQVRRLRDKLDELQKKIDHQSSSKPALRSTITSWQEQINQLSQRLETVRTMAPEPPEPITEICEEIGGELQKIEDELNSLQGLLPPTLFRKDPLRI